MTLRWPETGISRERISLEKFTDADITDRYLAWLSDPDVVRFSNQRFRKYDTSTAAAYLRSFDGTPNLFLKILRVQDGVAIGTLTAYTAPMHGTADIGVMVGEKADWGKGYGSEAWQTLLDWLLGEGGLRKVTAGTLAVNVGMLKLMQRSGMHHEATRYAQEIVDGVPVDIHQYAKFSSR